MFLTSLPLPNGNNKKVFNGFSLPKVAVCVFSIAITGCSTATSENLNSDTSLTTRDVSLIHESRSSRSLLGRAKSKNSLLKDRPEKTVINQAFSPKVEVYEGEKFADTSKSKTLSKVEFVDNTDPKFNAFRPKANEQTLEGVYAKIAQATLNAKKFSKEALLRSSEHKLEAHKQNLLPQVTPGASIDADGDTIVQLSVQQTIYDSGRYAAGKDILLSEKATARANLRTNENERIHKAISAYIDYHAAKAFQVMLSKTIKSFRKLEQQSESRIYNGIGDSSDRDLFQLKKLEVESEYENQEGIALSSKQVFIALTGIAMPTAKPEKMNLKFDPINAPQVALADAERDRAIGTMNLEKSNQRPLVSITGNVGTATDTFDDQNMDVRVDVSLSQPLTWGFDHASAAVQSEVEASNRKYDEIFKDTEDQINILKFELVQSRSRHKRLQRLSDSAEKRLKNFRSQFLAGQAGIAEATSTIESFKKIQSNAIETEFSIYSAELELATLTGALSVN